MSKKETLHIYVRCSTDNQNVDRQIELGKKFSKQMNMNYKIWNDEHKSGLKSFEDTREQFSELMWEVDLGYVKHIWCEDYSRLTRLLDDQMKIDTRVLENNLHIYEGLNGNQEYQPNDTMKRMYQIMKTMMGSDIKKEEIKKSIDRKIQKFRQGFYVRGNVSFGFDKTEDNYLKINREESKWVKKIFEWYSDGKSLRDIQKELKVNGVKTKRGNDWGTESISILLRNREYTGITLYTDMTKDPHRKNPKKYPYPDESKWVVYTNDNLPRIVSDELFDKCQKQLTPFKTQPTKYQYLLHGKIECKCGSDWVGRKTTSRGKIHFYYICSNSDRWYHRTRFGRGHLHKKGICDKPKRLSCVESDEFVWKTLMNTLRKSSFIKEKVKYDLLGGKYDTTSSRRMINKELRQTRKEIKSLEQSRVKLLKEKYLYELSEVDFNEIDSSITRRMVELKTEIQRIEKKERFLDKRSEWIEWIGEHHKSVDEYEKVIDVKQRRKILDIYVDRVGVDYNKETQQHDIKIHFRYPIINDGIEYTSSKSSKMKWDKWGNGYRIKKGDLVISLSDLSSKTTVVESVYSTVTDFAKFLG